MVVSERTDSEQLFEFGRTAFREANGDRKQAIELVKEWVREDPEIQQALISYYEDRALKHLIDDVMNLERRYAYRGSNNHHGETLPTYGIEGLNAVASTILDTYPVTDHDGHTYWLGDAWPELLDMNAGFHEKLARANVAKCRFLRTIRDEMGNAQRVRDALDAEMVIKIKLAVEEETGGKIT